jgi:hypothetical protein
MTTPIAQEQTEPIPSWQEDYKYALHKMQIYTYTTSTHRRVKLNVRHAKIVRSHKVGLEALAATLAERKRAEYENTQSNRK